MKLSDFSWKEIDSINIFIGFESDFGDMRIRIYAQNSDNLNKIQRSWDIDKVGSVFNYWEVAFFDKANKRMYCNAHSALVAFMEKAVPNAHSNLKYYLICGTEFPFVRSLTNEGLLLLLEYLQNQNVLIDNAVPVNSICSECGGKKILDFGFYQRQCMKCV